MNRRNLFLVIILLVLIIAAGMVAISWYTGQGNNNTANTTISNATSQNTFENQFIKFTVPAGILISDNSTDQSLDITLTKDGKEIGEITSAVDTQEAANELGGNNIKIAGKDAIELIDELGNSAYIKTSDSQGIWIDLESGHTTEYQTIRDSFVIKQVPTQ
jgi:hypothetical protein